MGKSPFSFWLFATEGCVHFLWSAGYWRTWIGVRRQVTPLVLVQCRQPASKAHVLSVLPRCSWAKQPLLLSEDCLQLLWFALSRNPGFITQKCWFGLNWGPGIQALLGVQSATTSLPSSFSCRSQMPESPGEAPAHSLFASVPLYVDSRTSLNEGR